MVEGLFSAFALLLIVILIFFVLCFLWLFLGRPESWGQANQDVNSVSVSNFSQKQNGLTQESYVSIDQASTRIKDVYKNDPEFQECATEVVQNCLTQSIGKKIKETGDLSFCSDFLTEAARESCTVTQSYAMARAEKDTRYCDPLPENQKRNCLQEVVTITAIDSGDLRRCDDLDECAQLECVGRAAERITYNTLDVKWCDNLEESNRDFCISGVQNRQNDRRLEE